VLTQTIYGDSRLVLSGKCPLLFFLIMGNVSYIMSTEEGLHDNI